MVRHRSIRMTLEKKLLKNKKKRWLDVGCGGKCDRGFFLMDTFPAQTLPVKLRRRYIQCDIANLPDAVVAKLGEFDLVRMQHTFEHFSYEEGQQVLKNCAKLLKKDGVLLISVPDLRVHVRRYLHNGYKKPSDRWWPHQRIPENSPPSFYFSIFTHSMPHEPHKWCYDYKGLRYQIESCGEFKDVRKLGYRNPLASYPFTHNRPDEDICAIAIKH